MLSLLEKTPPSRLGESIVLHYNQGAVQVNAP